MSLFSPSRLFGELAKHPELFGRILDDRGCSMETFTKRHVQTISMYQLRFRYGGIPLDYAQAVEVTQALWRYIQALYAGYGAFDTSSSQDDERLGDISCLAGLTQLIYISTATTALSEAELEQILDSSIRHNTPQQVTGMLLYASGSFMQILEGDEAAIDETFSRILEDTRHTRIILLHRGPLAVRRFKDWTMGFRSLGTQEAMNYPDYAPYFQHGFDARQIGRYAGLALQMLSDLGGDAPRDALH